ncbi:MAG: porin [Planctomycetota bacterium]
MIARGRAAALLLATPLGWAVGIEHASAQEAEVAQPWAALRPYEPGDGIRGHLGPLDLRLRTRIHADLVVPDLDGVGGALDKDFRTITDIRRARLMIDARGTEASGFRNLRVRGQMDFADLEVRWLDLYVRYDGLFDVGPIVQSNVRAGEFREPFGLEAMTSVTYLPFIERSTATSAFTPGRSRGAQVSLRGEKGLLQLGGFRRTSGLPFPDTLEKERAITGRAVWQPGGQGLVQAGGSVSFRDPNGELLVFRARTGSRFFDRLADTDRILADAATVAGVEALFQSGRWNAQAEWFGLWVDGANGEPGQSFLTGGYASASVFLGEGSTRWYPMRGSLRPPNVAPAWSDLSPRWGEFEAVARVSWTDLVDGSINGGRVLDVEAGLNWYLTSTTRLMVHWLGVRAEDEGGSGVLGQALLGRILIQI